MTTAQTQGSNILDVLKKKMRATKEESERFKEECDDLQRKFQVETMRREEVSSIPQKTTLHIYTSCRTRLIYYTLWCRYSGLFFSIIVIMMALPKQN